MIGGNMKVYISADIEGITGVSHWDETTLASRFLPQMTKEVSAACIGANEEGATEILVKDAHSSGRNIDPNGLPINTKIHRNWSMGPLSMMEGIDESFDCCLFIGYHSGAFVEGNPLAHTFSNSKFQYIKMNRKYMSEFELNMMIAHYYKVPVVFLSGDQALCNLAKEVQPMIETVAVMEGLGDSTISIHPELAILKIKDAVEVALKKDLTAVDMILPKIFKFEIQYKEAKLAYRASFYPGVQLMDPKTITYETQDYMEFLKMFMFIKI